MYMKKYFEEIFSCINTKSLLDKIKKLSEIERGQTFENYAGAAEYTVNLIKTAGMPDCRVIKFPADGKTVYQDKRMPLAWKASKGKLTVEKSSFAFPDPVLADYKRHPFHLVKGSTSTPPGGMQVKIITAKQMLAGENTDNALVLTAPETRPGAMLKTALDLGAVGIITDCLSKRENTPDGIPWATACTEGSNWHVQSEDRPFISFSISPRTGDMLRQACAAGEVSAGIESDGQRYEGEFAAVTALVPGRRKEELWVVSHLYEPLADDNSSGVVGSIEMARIIQNMVTSGQLPPLEFSLRLVFTLELYGFAAFIEHYKNEYGNRVIGAVNTDYMPLIKNHDLTISLAPPATPFFGNSLMEQCADEYQEVHDSEKLSIKSIIECGLYCDDACISDACIGIPTIWPMPVQASMWHNSEQTSDLISKETLGRIIAFTACWLAEMLTVNEKRLPEILAVAGFNAEKHLYEEKQKILDSRPLEKSGDLQGIREQILYKLEIYSMRLNDFKTIADIPAIRQQVEKLRKVARDILREIENKISNINKPPEKWFDYTATVIPKRNRPGFPQDLAFIPKEQRIELPDNVLYGPFARILANMDGRKSLQRLICEAQWEHDRILKPKKIKKYFTAISYLTDWGYLNSEFKQSYGKKEIVEALRRSGVKAGDLLMVHSSLSAFGRIEGGAETIIEALLEAVTTDGTLLFPTFTMSFSSLGGIANTNLNYRPFDINDSSQIWVGSIPKVFLNRKGIYRSKHPSHSVAGIGPLAEKCLEAHRETDPPTCGRSPYGKLLDLNGKILYFGCGFAPSTFLHFMEDRMNLPYLSEAICKIKSGNETRSVKIPRHLPGHRDFYTSDAENCKFFKEVIANGLEIKEASLGLGKLQLINASQLYNLGMKALKKNPNILLCDDQECSFCIKNKSS
jgi:aminoglycoside 3-N-acetyltransferase